jgi:hypothetical protein
MVKRNFLLGKGERLTSDVIVRSGPPNKQAPYTFGEARERLTPMLMATVEALYDLPDLACPDGQAVASVTLNPEYIAKSYYPADLLRQTGLQTVGSRPRRITPSKKSKGREPTETLTTELFVLGPKEAFREWKRSLPDWVSGTHIADDMATIEEIAAPTAHSKIKGQLPRGESAVFEVVLHTDQLFGEMEALPAFQNYVRSLGIEQKFDKRFYAGGLSFLELEAPVDLVDKIATFSIVRALRQMPRLRILRPPFRTSGVPSQSLAMPTKPALDPSIRTAIFDGGLPESHLLDAWTTTIDGPNVGGTHPELLKHGLQVTSALLFGSIDPTKPVPVPYSNVDHYRVLDTTPGQNPRELYEVLERIDNVLNNSRYDFANLSLGPSLSIEDDDVHAWTAVLDERLSQSDTLITIAVGNNGESDAEMGFNRIQVPADCVNALSIGAADSPDTPWQRSAYSAVGPGRSPGLMKPDLVEFGGSLARPFLVVAEGVQSRLEPTGGTSFASPSALRLATGIRAHFGQDLSLLAVRTLLVHSVEPSTIPHSEVGWGRLARDINDIVLCDDDTICVIYQGNISPAKYIRAMVPMPDGVLSGIVEISATLCYKCQTDPHHPGNYTRAGLQATFRPHDGKFKKDDQLHPNSKSFFGDPGFDAGEDELRRDAWKWENSLHANRRFNASSLSRPCFDIHYNARLEGRNFSPAEPLPYALAVTVHARKIADLYDQIVRKYATILEPIRPVVDIPIRT